MSASRMEALLVCATLNEARGSIACRLTVTVNAAAPKALVVQVADGNAVTPGSGAQTGSA